MGKIRRFFKNLFFPSVTIIMDKTFNNINYNDLSEENKKHFDLAFVKMNETMVKSAEILDEIAKIKPEGK